MKKLMYIVILLIFFCGYSSIKFIELDPSKKLKVMQGDKVIRELTLDEYLREEEMVAEYRSRLRAEENGTVLLVKDDSQSGVCYIIWMDANGNIIYKYAFIFLEPI